MTPGSWGYGRECPLSVVRGRVRAAPVPDYRDTMIVQASTSPRVRSTATAFPAHSVDQAGAARALQQLFPEEDRERIEVLVRNSGVKHRNIAVPVAETVAPSTFTDRNRVYRGVALDLARRAA